MNAREISKLLASLADPERAVHARRYFKTGAGEYGAGDRFLGIRVPDLRAQVKKCDATTLDDIRQLLQSGWHEERLFALLLLVHKFGKSDGQAQAAICDLYLAHRHRVNNWDLVDSSASQIVGRHLASGDRQLLYELARSASLWDRRIAIIASFHFIRNGQFDDALRLAKLLIDDDEDLIHKAVGWMLREIGKRDMAAEQTYLRAHYRDMPRTMLRYAIERFPEPLRKQYLAGEI